MSLNVYMPICFSRTMSVQFSSVHSKMVSMRSGKSICAPPRLSKVSPKLPLKQFQCSSDWRWPSLVLSRKFVYRFRFPRHSPPGDRKRDVLGFVPAGLSQAPQHFRSSDTQATWDGCFAASLSARSFIYKKLPQGYALIEALGDVFNPELCYMSDTEWTKLDSC